MPELDGHDVRLIRLLTRRPGTDPAAFQRDWISVGAGAVAAMPGILRHGQNHALLQGYARGPLIFDGFEEFGFASAEALSAALAHPAWSSHRAALAPLISAPESPSSVVRISVQKAGSPPRGAIRSTEFVNRRPDLDSAAFDQYWMQHHGPLASGIPQILRYEQHHLDRVADDEAVLHFDGWAATWFTSTATMRASAAEPLYASVRADEANFLAGPLPVLFTSERLSYLSG